MTGERLGEGWRAEQTMMNQATESNFQLGYQSLIDIEKQVKNSTSKGSSDTCAYG